MCSEKVAPLGTYDEGLLEGLRKLPGASSGGLSAFPHNQTCRVLRYNHGRIYLHLGPVETLGSCFWSVCFGQSLVPKESLTGAHPASGGSVGVSVRREGKVQ